MISENQISNFIKNPKTQYKIIKLNINKNIIDILNKFIIDDFSCFNHCDENKLLNLDKLKLFIQNIGNNSSKSINLIVKFINNLTNNVCKEFDKKYCWLTIRISKANNLFDIPRWHYDGSYYKNIDNIPQAKFILTLKGPSTLVINPTEKIIKKFMNIRKKVFEQNKKSDLQSDELKKKLLINKLLKNEKIKKIKTLHNGIISISHITIHSEPPITEDRIFLSILPLSKEEYEFFIASNFFNNS